MTRWASDGAYLPAGSTKNALQFTYSLSLTQDDMADGTFEITIPRAWVITEVIEIEEGTTPIFRKGLDVDAESPSDDDLNMDDRTTVTKIGDNVSVVKVKLGATPEASNSELEITFYNVTAPNPSSLLATDPNGIRVKIDKFPS